MTQFCERHPSVERILNGCYQCGAPQCCPACCREAEEQNEAHRRDTKLRALAEAATPGPWRHSSYGIMGHEEAVVSWRYAWEDGEERNRPYIVAADPPTILALLDERDSLATQLEQMRCERDEWKRASDVADVAMHAAWSERDEARSDRDAMAQTLGETRADLAEARATNARLHRRAQGVEAGKPEDAETIRRLRAEVRATAVHAGHVAGHVHRIIDARNAELRRTYAALRERDDARSKLARIRDVVTRDSCDCRETSAWALCIIDEKEGGQ